MAATVHHYSYANLLLLCHEISPMTVYFIFINNHQDGKLMENAQDQGLHTGKREKFYSTKVYVTNDTGSTSTAVINAE